MLSDTRTTKPGSIEWGDLRRLEPVSRVFGLDRGLPVDRFYIERFLATATRDIRGSVLEFGDDTYTRRFGGDRVQKSDVLSVTADTARKAGIVADLTRQGDMPKAAYDCIICTQTLHCIRDMQAAVRTLHGMLRPGGALLATCPGISQISSYDMQRWGDYWRLTSLAARSLFEGVFGADGITIEAHGNVLVAAAFLYGLAADELKPEELDHRDSDYELVITIRAARGA